VARTPAKRYARAAISAGIASRIGRGGAPRTASEIASSPRNPAARRGAIIAARSIPTAKKNIQPLYRPKSRKLFTISPGG